MAKLLVFCLLVFAIGCTAKTFNPMWTKERAPASFIARFETSKGNFDIELFRDWSPLAVDRVYQLVNHRYFDNNLFYRVVPNFVVQFGNTDTVTGLKWERYNLKDEPVVESNVKGSVSFARAGKDSRGTHLFINLADNISLDTLNYEGATGFPVLGRVTTGMDVVETIYSGYGNETLNSYDSLSPDRRRFLQAFPKLDSIRRAYIVR